MFRAFAAFLFMICILPFTAVLSYRVMLATGLAGLPAYLVAVTVFVLIVTATVILLAAFNDHINASDS